MTGPYAPYHTCRTLHTSAVYPAFHSSGQSFLCWEDICSCIYLVVIWYIDVKVTQNVNGTDSHFTNPSWFQFYYNIYAIESLTKKQASTDTFLSGAKKLTYCAKYPNQICIFCIHFENNLSMFLMILRGLYEIQNEVQNNIKFNGCI